MRVKKDDLSIVKEAMGLLEQEFGWDVSESFINETFQSLIVFEALRMELQKRGIEAEFDVKSDKKWFFMRAEGEEFEFKAMGDYYLFLAKLNNPRYKEI